MAAGEGRRWRPPSETGAPFREEGGPTGGVSAAAGRGGPFGAFGGGAGGWRRGRMVPGRDGAGADGAVPGRAGQRPRPPPPRTSLRRGSARRTSASGRPAAGALGGRRSGSTGAPQNGDSSIRLAERVKVDRGFRAPTATRRVQLAQRVLFANRSKTMLQWSGLTRGLEERRRRPQWRRPSPSAVSDSACVRSPPPARHRAPVPLTATPASAAACDIALSAAAGLHPACRYGDIRALRDWRFANSTR